ncbi:MAG: hypothetical protein KAS61_10095, partial [Spirochaetes bacterium]|nr:hypothetical protein [Spirochaetota bacterium]
ETTFTETTAGFLCFRTILTIRAAEVDFGTQSFFLRTELRGNCVDILRAVGVRIPSAVRQ